MGDKGMRGTGWKKRRRSGQTQRASGADGRMGNQRSNASCGRTIIRVQSALQHETPTIAR